MAAQCLYFVGKTLSLSQVAQSLVGAPYGNIVSNGRPINVPEVKIEERGRDVALIDGKSKKKKGSERVETLEPPSKCCNHSIGQLEAVKCDG